MENWENLQDRVFHLGWLAEELPDFVDRGFGGAWLFRELAREAQIVADTAAAYVGECEKAGLSGPGGDTPNPPPWRQHPDHAVCGGPDGRDRPPDTGGTAGGGGVA